MPANFPTELDDFSAQLPRLVVDLEDGLEAVEAKLGKDGSAVTTSVDYKLAGLRTDVDGKAVTGHLHAGTYVGTPTPGIAHTAINVHNARDFAATTAQRDALLDGLSKPLSGFYGSLGAAQAAYPQATDPSNQLDTIVVNKAIKDVSDDGGGTVWVPKEPEGGGLVISRWTHGVQNGGGLHLEPGVNLIGDRTKLLLNDNCAFIWANVPLGTTSPTNTNTITANLNAVITANTAAETNVLTVDSSAGFVVGDVVKVILGQAAYDAGEPDWWLFAKVAALPDATTITLDRPVNHTMIVASTDTLRRRVIRMHNAIHDVTIKGFDLDYFGGIPLGYAEYGVVTQHCWNVKVEDITGRHTGAGLWAWQYVQDMVGRNLHLRSSNALDGHTSKGRFMSGSEGKNVLVDGYSVEDFQRHVLFVESSCRNIVARNGRVVNNHATRANTTEPLFGALGKAEILVDGLHVTGNPALIHTVGNPALDSVRVRNSSWDTKTLPTDDNPSFLDGTVRIEDLILNELRTFTKTFLLDANGDLSNVFLTLPSGYYRRARLWVSTATGIGLIGINDGTNFNGFDSLVAGVVNANILLGFPTRAGRCNQLTPKTLEIFPVGVGTPIPAGAWGWLEVEYWPTINSLQGFGHDARSLHVSRSPNGTLHGVTVENDGALKTVVLV